MGYRVIIFDRLLPFRKARHRRRFRIAHTLWSPIARIKWRHRVGHTIITHDVTIIIDSDRIRLLRYIACIYGHRCRFCITHAIRGPIARVKWRHPVRGGARILLIILGGVIGRCLSLGGRHNGWCEQSAGDHHSCGICTFHILTSQQNRNKYAPYSS